MGLKSTLALAGKKTTMKTKNSTLGSMCKVMCWNINTTNNTITILIYIDAAFPGWV